MKLPDFIIIGTQKGGTTALAGQLRRHPLIYMPPNEAHFFDTTKGTGLRRYSALFKGSYLNGEKTPKYLADPMSLMHISQALPKVKLIALLRDPVRRFYSNHRHWNRIRRAHKRHTARQFLDTREGLSARWKGLYHLQLETLFQLFEPHQLHIEFSEVLRTDTEAAMGRVQTFLGVGIEPLANKPRLEKELEGKAGYEGLVDYYREPNERLADLLASQGFDNAPIGSWLGAEV